MLRRAAAWFAYLREWAGGGFAGVVRGRLGFSIAVHGVVLFVLLNAWWFGAKHLKRAGSSKGTQVMLNYATGKPSPEPAPRRQAPVKPRQSVTKLHSNTPVPVQEEATAAPAVEAQGDGPASILFVQAFPSQRPQLSNADATSDLIVDVQIDEKGRVVETHKRRGMSAGVDEVVIATVQQWIFHPAMKDGHAIPSVQELHFRFDARKNPACGWECFQLLAD